MIYTYDFNAGGSLPLTEIKEHFDRDGVVAIANILPEDHLLNLRIEAELCLQSSGVMSDIGDLAALHRINTAAYSDDGGSQPVSTKLMMHLCHMRSAFRQHATAPRLAQVITHLFNGGGLLYTDLLFNKHTRGGEKTILHQDHAYYTDVTPYKMITCWYALDDIDENNGCLEYALGYQSALIPHREISGAHVLSLLPEDVPQPFTPAPVKAGTALFHHSLTVHGSGPNMSENRRRAIATVYMPVSAHRSENFSFPFRMPEL